MARKSSWPPKVYPHKPSGQDRVRINGQDFYLGPIGSEESRQAYVALLDRISKGELPGAKPSGQNTPVPAGPTVGIVLARWLSEAGPLVCTERGGELREYRHTFQPLDRLFGALPAANFGTAELLTLRAAMLSGSWMTPEDRARSAKRRNRQGWCRRMVNQRLARVRAVWSWAELAGLVPRGSFAALQAVRPLRRGAVAVRESLDPRPATLAEVKRVCAEFPPHARVLSAMLLFGWWTGARPGEVRTMRAGDVDCSDPTAWLYRPRQHKTDRLGHSRLVPIGPKARAVLRPWLAAALAVGPDAPVFPPSRLRRGKGSVYTRQSFSRAVTRAAARAGMPEGWTGYSTRHGACDRIRRAAGPEAAQHVLGHRSPAMTSQYGCRTDHAHAADVQRRLG